MTHTCFLHSPQPPHSIFVLYSAISLGRAIIIHYKGLQSTVTELHYDVVEALFEIAQLDNMKATAITSAGAMLPYFNAFFSYKSWNQSCSQWRSAMPGVFAHYIKLHIWRLRGRKQISVHLGVVQFVKKNKTLYVRSKTYKNTKLKELENSIPGKFS